MKKQILYMIAYMVLGVLAASLVAAILMSLALPDLASSAILTWPEYQDYQHQAALFGKLDFGLAFIAVFGFLITAGGFLLLMSALNPNINWKNLKNGRAAGKALVIVLAVMLLGALLGFLTDVTSGIGWEILFSSLIMGAVWLVAGETGWGGDLTSWTHGNNLSGPDIPGTLVMGALWGLTLPIFEVLFNRAGGKYFILVSEVLDGTGETSLAGFLLLFAGMAFLLSFSSGILIGLVFPLAPVKTALDDRKRLLLAPGILVLPLLLIMGGGYLYSVAQYDLGVGSLSKAAGLEAGAPEVMTLVNLTANGEESEPTGQPWLMETEIGGMAYSGTITVTGSNLRKLEGFLKEKQGRTIYQYPAMDALIKGYFISFNVNKGEKWLNAYSLEAVFPRMIQLHRLRHLPVTPENRALLSGYADESIWHVPGKAAFTLARAFDHFGMRIEAQSWLDRAVSEGVDTGDFSLSVEPALTEGWISGKIAVNENPARNVVIGLMRYNGVLEKITVTQLELDLLSTAFPGEDGSFTFTNLGAGEYRIIVLLHENIDPSTIQISRQIEPVILSNEIPRINLGTFEIGFKF